MKTKKILWFAFVLIGVFAISCNNCQCDKSPEKEIITKKIMYDVLIINEDIVTEEDYQMDWFWNNLPEKELDALITKLYDDVKDGKIQAWHLDPGADYEEFSAIPTDEILSFFENEWYVWEDHMVDNPETNEEEAVTIEIPLDRKQIKRLRFLEEWYFVDGEFFKRVIAVAPLFIYETSAGLGINGLYWVYIKDLKD